MPSQNRIDSKFQELKKRNKKALIIYLTCGYPDLKTTQELVLSLDKAGVDIIELGIPFSDPLADGPIIQQASFSALKNHITLDKIFSLVSRLRRKTEIPIALMGYYNPIFNYGIRDFFRKAEISGVDGVIVPDLPPEEAQDLIKSARQRRIAAVFFLSPTSDEPRIKLVSKAATGFIYYVSLTGVTGIKENLPKGLGNKIRQIRQWTKKPVCIGFGISKARHVKEVFRISDGAVVGSALIKVIRENIGRKDLVDKAAKFAAGLREENTD